MTLGTRMTSGRAPAGEDQGGRMNRASSRNAEPAQDQFAVQELTPVRVDELPKEAGWLLITAGVVGVVVPGVLGTPFLLAGAVVLVPGGSRLLSRWAGHSAMRQIGRFLDDLERRYPRR
jgi:hypothetical protein